MPQQSRLIAREQLAEQGFIHNDEQVADLFDNHAVNEYLWMTTSDDGEVIMYYDAGNSWCQVVYDSRKDKQSV